MRIFVSSLDISRNWLIEGDGDLYRRLEVENARVRPAAISTIATTAEEPYASARFLFVLLQMFRRVKIRRDPNSKGGNRISERVIIDIP